MNGWGRSLAAWVFTICLLGGLWAGARPASADRGPVDWRSRECERDGTPFDAKCIPPSNLPQVPRAHAPSCAGAVFCMATYEQMRKAGLDTSVLEAHDRQNWRQMHIAHSTSPDTYYHAFVEFDLYLAPTNCSGTVKQNDHCGWLYHKYTIDDGSTIYTTSYPARSGNNKPADKWVVNTGPMPDTWASSSPTIASPYRRMGWMKSVYYGYQSDSDPSFSPGKWRLDPWDVYSKSGQSGTHRSSFEIHGGTGTHDFWQQGTSGCIRLPSTSITGLKSLWDTRSSNRQDPYVSVRDYYFW
jgi:hypothetical protein